MFEHADDSVDRAARQLQQPVQIDPALDGRVMREITALPAPGRGAWLGEVWRWLRRPHQVTLTPPGALATAAALGVVVLLSWMSSKSPAPRPAASRTTQFAPVPPRAT